MILLVCIILGIALNVVLYRKMVKMSTLLELLVFTGIWWVGVIIIGSVLYVYG